MPVALTVLPLLLMMVTSPTRAEEAAEPAAGLSEQVVEAPDIETAFEAGAGIVEEVVVTGSRLSRNTYTSVSPLQVVTAEAAREVGLIDAASILQNAPASRGQQIDLTFGGFVLDNGPGASTVDLRGLGADRTLVLLNGRRLAPAGVEGAPVSPDLNLIPAMLVQQYDILLDGASSIYGSDAIAGVTNIILRKDFEGLEVSAYSTKPEATSGETNSLSVVWGTNSDRGFFGFGAEYQESDGVTYADREWTKRCDRNMEIDQNGKRRSRELFYSTNYGMDWDECALGALAGRVSVPFAGSVYYTPGYTNGGWPNFSESNSFGIGVDGNGDGKTDLTFRDYDLNGRDQDAHIFPGTDRLNLMAYGEYTFEGEANLTPFFEVMYSRRNLDQRSTNAQLFPDVPADNPYNLCNPDGLAGVDCGIAYSQQLVNPSFESDFADYYGDLCASFGVPPAFCTPTTFGLLEGPVGAQDVIPIVVVRGDRDNARAEVAQYRTVAGVKGDLPFLNVGTLGDWQFDASISYSRSKGESSRRGIRGDRLEWSLANSVADAGGAVTCPQLPGDDKSCVPINLFAPSLYQGIIGDFATSAEREYLMDSRDFDTEIEQTLVTGFASGKVFTLPAGDVMFGLGLEYRKDEIQSTPDDIARDGLFFGFFSDGGANGDKWTKEAYAELELPLLADKPFFNELTLNLSGRYTDDEYYGSDNTYATKLGWRPVDFFLIRATVGTSFRAPNLRENFLRNQSGFTNVFDPCAIPDAAIDDGPGGTGGYNPSLDQRPPEVLANCRANGVDPTTLDLNGFNTYSVEIAQGGALDLSPETSDSYTVGFAFDQPFFDSFDMTIGATYYRIEIENSIIEPSSQFIVNDCYGDVEGDSRFCTRVNRDAQSQTLSLLDGSFINRDQEVNRGVDVNVTFDKEGVVMFGYPVDIGLDLSLNRNLEASIAETDERGVTTEDDFTGDFGFPHWKGFLGLRLNIEKYRFSWQIEYIGDVDQDRDAVDEFSDINGIGNTCLGPDGGDVLCRDVGFADSYLLHSMSVFYYGDKWTIGGGIRNVFDNSPPEVDGTEVLSINNAPIGYGYDIGGRTAFLDLTVIL
ncbi:MAG: TonB-dependent receptor domain-containing protein [Pseudomonadales bacterium]